MSPLETRNNEDRRKFMATAVMLTTVIVAMTVIFMLNSSAFKPPPGTSGPQIQQGTPAIDEAYGGAHPTSPGDRGGWQQLALLGVIVVAVSGGVTTIVLTSRKARRALAAERATTATPEQPDTDKPAAVLDVPAGHLAPRPD